ncbi:hypothetical protein AAFC00_005329 [Neodothiora populina]|uniref:F-box domain-containing protein n=1 Tax=Neodothiora populina TaxID=2781224 RepID=A0ABR3PLM6_9PEZI
MAIATPSEFGLVRLPTELIIDTITKVEWEQRTLCNLRLVCRNFDDILRSFENTITNALLQSQFPSSSRNMFPSLFQEASKYSTVSEVQRRWDILGRLEHNCVHIGEREGKQGWMIPRSIKIHSTGLCLLFRLQDVGSGGSQATLIRSLPCTSLLVLLFSLTLSLHQLRVNGPDILNSSAPVQCAAFRAEMELACLELLLQHGPQFLLSLLEKDSNAMSLLESEYDRMEIRQMAYPDGTPKPPTLISVLRRTLSARLECDWRDHHKYMLNFLHEERFHDISEEDTSKIVQGLDPYA